MDSNFQTLANALPDVVVVADVTGGVHFINNAGRSCLGVPSGTRAGRWIDHVQAGHRANMSALISDVIGDGVARDITVRLIHLQTGDILSMPCRVCRIVASEADTRPAVLLVARAQDNDAIARLAEMFAGVVGHDLRNPLNAMLTGAHVAMKPSHDEPTTAALQGIISSGHRMQRMIDQLLDLSLIRAGGGLTLDASPADLREIMQHVLVEVTAADLRSDVRLAVRGDTHGEWDATRLAQCMTNVIANAIQHGAPDHPIDLTVDGTVASTVMVAVHNAGMIAADALPILFNPFRIVHPKRAKTRALGFGLYISRQIARAHGGEIEVSSDADAGTTFRISLARHPVETPRPASSGVGEDEMAILGLMATTPKATSVTAQLFGAVPLHERAPQEYWQLFDRYAKLLDVALDHQTYRIDGVELSQELRTIADLLGGFGAGAREVAQLHARALRQKTHGVSVTKAQAFTAEGRLVSFELMGHLLSFYRRRSGAAERT
ncbi:MAG TPA: HAMP domain-containing sensor histidine kinase [Vicinamibacterales bacterium]|nr:HAMP domain-containing sensor histidine kinase [Vicinamibacterales bacterium]